MINEQDREGQVIIPLQYNNSVSIKLLNLYLFLCEFDMILKLTV